jgi:hypothetical protein
MSSEADLRTAARLQPALYRRYVETERRLDFTLSMSGRGLEEITGVAAGGSAKGGGRERPGKPYRKWVPGGLENIG